MNATATATAPETDRIAQLEQQLATRAAEMSCLLFARKLGAIIPSPGSRVDLDYIAHLFHDFAAREFDEEDRERFFGLTKEVYVSTNAGKRDDALAALEVLFNDADKFVIDYREGILKADSDERDCLQGCFGWPQEVSDELSRLADHLGLWLNWFESAGAQPPANHWAKKGGK